jgi:hypothetical protein
MEKNLRRLLGSDGPSVPWFPFYYSDKHMVRVLRYFGTQAAVKAKKAIPTIW